MLPGKYPGGIIKYFRCAASKFGAKTGIVTTVGEDSFGQTAIEGLDEFGVDRGGLVVKKGESTYFGVIYWIRQARKLWLLSKPHLCSIR